MAITGSTVTANQSLEEFRLEFNKIVSDVSQLESNPTYGTSLIFEGATDDAFETTFTVADPSADRTVTVPDADGTILLTGAASFAVADGGTLGSSTTADAMTIASDGVVTFASSPAFTSISSGSTFTIDATTDIILDADGGDVFLKDAGSTFGSLTNTSDNLIIKSGTTTAATFSGANTTLAGTLGVGAITTTGAFKGADGYTIGNASVADIMTLASTGIVTFKDDIVLKNDATIGSAGAATAMTISSGGIVTFVDDIKIKDGGTIGTATTAAAITIAAAGALTLSGRSVHSAGITVPDDGEIGSASDPNAIVISSAGVVTLSSSTASSSKTTGALVVTGGIGTSADLYVGDLLNVEGGINIAGSNQELRFYEGANYVGFEAPALSADQIWVLPSADAGTSGDVLMSNASGTLSFSTAVSGVASSFTASANNSTNETVYPVFVDGATGAQGAETDTGLTYNPSTGLITTAKLVVADGGTVGSASSASAITIASGGVVTFVDDIVIKDDGTIGSASAVGAITLDSSGNATFSQNLTVTGVTTLNGNLVLGDAAADTLTIGATLQGASPLIFEGATANNYETTFAITDPTADRTITFPNETGTVHTSGGTTTHTTILVADAGTVGSASDPNAIGISAGGVVSITATSASTSATSGALTVAGGAGVAADLGVGDDLFMISDGSVITFGANSEIKLTHVHDTGLSITSTAAAPLVRRGEDVFIVLDQTAAAGTDAGDNVIMDRSAADTDVGDDIIGEDEVFLHSGMQRNVLQIKGSNGKILISVAGFAPGAI